MAFQPRELRSANSLGGGSSFWFYDTEDTTTGSAGYFNSAANNLRVGDRIFITVFTNLNKSNEAYASNAEYVVTAVTASTVTVV